MCIRDSQNGLEAAVKKLAAAGTPVLGVCGGYQMLGTALDDPDGVEPVSYTHLGEGPFAFERPRDRGGAVRLGKRPGH